MAEVTENFNNALGEWVNYDTYNTAQKFSFLPNQKHLNLRSFDSGSSEQVIDMLYLNTQTMTELNGDTMAELADVAVIATEPWTVGTVGPISSADNWNGLNWSLTTGINESVSTLTDAQGNLRSLDLETGFEDDDFISFALPAFPLASINTDESFIRFTSNPNGAFNSLQSPIASVAFSQSTVALTAGNSELRFPRSAIIGIDLSSVTAILLHVIATADCTFKCTGIRLLSSSWVYSSLDIDTVNQRVSRTPSLDGDTSPTPAVIADPFPVMIRSDELFGPAPINSELSVAFNLGSQSTDGEFDIYLRQRSIDFTTMLDLDGTNVSDLDGQPQPNFSPARYASRTQADLDGSPGGIPLEQEDLDGITQFVLERKPDPLSAAYLQVRLSWTDSSATLDVLNSEHLSPFYSFSPNLDPNQEYALIINLVDETMDLAIYELDTNVLGTQVFNSDLMTTPLLLRYAGRIGWWADFGDGDAYISSLLPRHLVFAELKSHPYIFQTQIKGVQLQTGSTPPSNLFRGIDKGPFGGFFQAYPQRGPESFQMHNTAGQPWQGIRTNFMNLNDFTETVVEFDLFVTKELLDSGSIEVYLWDGITPTPLPYGPVNGDTWNHVFIDLGFVTNRLTGPYAIVLAQSSNTNSLWAIDKFRVWQTNIRWEARDYHFNDLWGLDSTDWVEFGQTVNGANDGVVLRQRTSATQLRAQALHENAVLGEMRVTPQYAPLGRVVFPEDYPPAKYLDDANFPTSDFNQSVSGLTVTLDTTATVPNAGQRIIQTVWTFGDGAEDTGTNLTHTYNDLGSYTVTQTVTDNNGLRSSSAQTVTIS